MTATPSHSEAETERQERETLFVRLLRVLGVQLGLVAAGLHFYWGVPRAIVYLQAGTAADPRPYLFVVSGIAVTVSLVGLYLVPEYFPERPVYAFASFVMLVWIGGYVWWHLGGHGGAIPGVQGYGHPSLSNLGVLFSDQHLFQPLDFATVTTGAGALVAFLSLLAHDWLEN